MYTMDNVIYTFFTSRIEAVNSSTNYYTVESMGYITTRQRSIFFALFLLLYVAALIGNSTAIVVTCGRKHRYIQKALIISLALSDLIMASAYAVQYLNTFTHALLNWTMGEVMCFLIPFLQLFGMSASSGAILIIALDRYRSAVDTTMKRWNPNLWLSLAGISLLWTIAIGLAYPTQLLIEYKSVIIVSEDEDDSVEYVDAYICIGTRNYVMIYYICIILTTFLPLLIMVLWLYYNICKLVYNQDTVIRDSTTEIQPGSDTAKSILKNRTNSVLTVSRKLTFQAQRKIRVFKIMVFVILAFIICRSPHWIYKTVKLTYTLIDNQEWIVAFLLGGLVFINCVLNPFLYTFLPQTITRMSKIWKTISDFICDVCCCCCSNAEFEQFERENPFSVQNYDREANSGIQKQTNKNQKVKFNDVITTEPRSNKRY